MKGMLQLLSEKVFMHVYIQIKLTFKPTPYFFLAIYTWPVHKTQTNVFLESMSFSSNLKFTVTCVAY